jgi:hypothetical protein
LPFKARPTPRSDRSESFPSNTLSKKRQGVFKTTSNGEVVLKTIFKIIAVLVIVSGGIWFLQGVNILPGSYMTGNPQWAVNGAIAVFMGTGLFWFANRK